MEEWNKVEKNVWDFKKNPEIIGTLKETPDSVFKGKDYVITDEEGKDHLVYGKTALQTKMNGIKEGTKVKIVFLGEKRSDKDRVYEDYDVYTSA